ncbi:chorismate mutase aro7 [Phlyctochytrium planicorne]|nr:chorismate mutase aro7 [Phlyctochytrium planicorne]
MNFSQEALSLNRIRDELIKMEDTIIFALIERAEFAQNPKIYQPGGISFENFEGSFLDFFLYEIESAHAKVRRYTSPDEYPFSKNLPEPILPNLAFPRILVPNSVNLNEKLREIYLREIVPRICKPGDDLNYGSSATKDTEALQMLSRRIHFGKFVAEAKFQDPKYHEEYVRLIKAKDRVGIEELLTNKAVEERVLRRLRKKALIYGQEIEDDGEITLNVDTKNLKIPLDVVTNLYEQYVIPLTKEVEVEYLLIRLDHPTFFPEIKKGEDVKSLI